MQDGGPVLPRPARLKEKSELLNMKFLAFEMWVMNPFFFNTQDQKVKDVCGSDLIGALVPSDISSLTSAWATVK